MWNEEMSVCYNLQTISVVHRIIGNEKELGCNKDKERGETERGPENSFESGSGGSGR
ncbi:hypothetical protein GCM10011507_15790 [Edaphobacter acidisoli]|uniref:Uncharacterized protein n=1 Tax=Edaphobacter acidisoli TaxID=2040573 RepID=A0A916RQJ9_9BACT|nr:hypothetical protein GCM10011507_15790 [Edaphobacter acidisoli]